MVFGNRGDDSGTGVAFTRDPATGEKVPYGDYLAERAGRGRRGRHPQHAAARRSSRSSTRPPTRELLQVMDTLERHYRDMCDIEFTIEKGKLWILQTRIGKRTAFAEWVMAARHARGGPDRRGHRAAARRREPARGAVQAAGGGRRSATPIATGPERVARRGHRRGRVHAPTRPSAGPRRTARRSILVRRETTPDDYHGMIAAQGILTSAGGTNSHAAVVARGEGIPAVCGADQIRLDLEARAFTRERHGRARGRRDHDRRLHRQRLRRRAAARGVGAREGARRATRRRASEPIWQAFERLMADRRRAPAPARARERRHARPVHERPRARRRGHRPVPHRAHVPRAGARARRCSR